jgi:hypothetical protein
MTRLGRKWDAPAKKNLVLNGSLADALERIAQALRTRRPLLGNLAKLSYDSGISLLSGAGADMLLQNSNVTVGFTPRNRLKE